MPQGPGFWALGSVDTFGVWVDLSATLYPAPEFHPTRSPYPSRQDDYLTRHCEDLLTPAELAWLRRCDNPPVKVLIVMSTLVKR